MHLRNLIDRIKIVRAPFEISLDEIKEEHVNVMTGEVRIGAQWHVPDTNNEGQFVNISSEDWFLYDSDYQFIARVERLIRSAFDHEARECLRVDGKKWNDPHDNDDRSVLEAERMWRKIAGYWR